MTLLHGGSLQEAMRLAQKMGFSSGKEENWLDLSTGINPHPYPLPEFTARDWHQLPEPDDLKALLKAASGYYSLQDEGNLLAVGGSALAIQLLPLFLDEKPVFLNVPIYGDHLRAWQNAGAKCEGFQCLKDVPSGVIAVLANPNNPDGRRFSKDELEQFATRNTHEGGFLIVDEAFGDLYPKESVIHLIKSQNVVVLKSFGKFFGHAGVRLGFLAAPDNVIERLRPLLASWPVSGPAIKLGLAAFNDEDWQRQTRLLLKEKTEKITHLFKKAEISIHGQTSLFTLIESEGAENLFQTLLKNKIYVRQFPENKKILRFGLPKTEGDFEKLEKVLCL